MRIAYSNLLDPLASTLITPSTEATLYEATQIQDDRLTTQWRTTSATDQTIIFDASAATIVGGNIGLVTGSAATNLITDPENLTSANWTATGSVITTAESILGYPAYEITSNQVNGGLIQNLTPATGVAMAAVIVVRKGVAGVGNPAVFDGSALAWILDVTIDFDTKAITYTRGTEAIAPEWIDDNTVRLFTNLASSSVGNTLQTYLWAQATADSVIYSAPMIVDNTYPVPYVATSRTAVLTTYSQKIPPSGKFIIDMELFPYWNYDIASDVNILEWQTGTFYVVYSQSVDQMRVQFNSQTLDSQQFYASTLNQYHRITTSLDLSVASASGSELYIDGVLIDDAWSGEITPLSSGNIFNTVFLARLADSATQYADGIFRFFRIYGGNFDTTYSTEAEIDTALESRQLLFDQTYQNQFNFDTVAIMGHNISEGAQITFQANDYNEWNYTDGSGSSIIQEELTWDEATILKMITKTKKQYVKFTINDPNNDDGILKIGRMWVGPYITIDPSSLDDFTVKKKRSDDVQYGKNRQKWANENVGWREFNLRFPRTASTTLNAIQTMYDTVGNHSSLIFMNFNTLRTWPLIEPLYCSINGDLTFGHRGRQKYTYGLNLEESR